MGQEIVWRYIQRFTDRIRPADVTLIALFFIGLAVSGQLMDPYISHDDYLFLYLPFGHFWENTLSEGRWLTMLWSAVSPILTPVTAHFLFAGSWALIATRVSGFSKCFSTPFAFFFPLSILGSPSFLGLSTWPTTLLPCVLLVLLFVYLYPEIQSSACRRFAVFIFVFATAQSYPPLAVCILASAILLKQTTAREGLLLAAITCLALLASIVLSAALNFMLHGHFGVVLASWRNPNVADNLTDLVSNAMTMARGYWRKLAAIWAPLAIFAAGISLTSGRHVFVAMLPMAVGLSLDGAITLSTGIVADDHAYVWMSMAALAPFPYISDAGRRFLQSVAIKGTVSLCCVILILNNISVFSDLHESKIEQRLVADIALKTGLEHGATKYIVVGVGRLRLKHPHDLVSLMRFQRNYHATPCHIPEICAEIDMSRRGIYAQTIHGENYVILNL